jgi:hypothetical protein
MPEINLPVETTACEAVFILRGKSVKNVDNDIGVGHRQRQPGATSRDRMIDAFGARLLRQQRHVVAGQAAQEGGEIGLVLRA